MIDKNEFRKFAVKDQNISGSAFDSYVQHIESMTRAVIEERPTNFREIDVFSRLIMDRIIFLGLPVDDNIANIITAQLLFLQSTDAKKEVMLYINSPGGSVNCWLGIYDTMQYITPEVATICTGLAASMGAVFTGWGCSRKKIGTPSCKGYDPPTIWWDAGSFKRYGNFIKAYSIFEKGVV